MDLTGGSLLSSLLQPSHCFIAPKICPNENIAFYLYTSENDSLILSVSDPDSIRSAPFRQGPIKILIHGYTAGRDETPNKEIRPAYFQSGREVNVITMDFAPLVQNGCYFHAVPNTGVAANCTAQFIDRLLKLRSEIELSRIHLIGHSLGAQVAGQVHGFLKSGRIERITALDAALPLYLRALTPNFLEINQGDAKFIDAIHTNSGLAGQSLPFGDVDFYANNGVFQPGCSLNLVCDHARSAIYFAESINSEIGFTAYKCSCPPPYAWGRCFKKDGPTALFGEYDCGGVCFQNRKEISIRIARGRAAAQVFENANTSSFPPLEEQEAAQLLEYCANSFTAERKTFDFRSCTKSITRF